MDCRPPEAKGARLITYSKSFPRKVVGHSWVFYCEGSILWRKKLAMFAGLHRIRDLDQMKSRFGPRWAWWLRDLIESLNVLPSLPFDQVRAYIEGLDAERLSAALDAGGRLTTLHLYRPKLPEVDGRSLSPPRRLRAVFGFHLSSWDMTREEMAFAVIAERKRVTDPNFRTYFTEEMRQAARETVLAVSGPSAASIRAKNYMRACHPHVYSKNCV